jgi:hypothetical protein
MKTYVFVFVPLEKGEQFQSKLKECLRAIPDAPPDDPTNEKEEEESYPYWTWFLPNPLWPPKNG